MQWTKCASPWTQSMQHHIDDTDFFAFVEAVEEFPDFLVKDPSALDREWQGVLKRREKYGLEPPTHSVWLDCIDADYFLQLDWIDEKLDDRDPQQRRERRRHIQSLDDAYFRVIQAFFTDYGKVEAQQLASLINSHWHRIQISSGGEQPILVASSYNAAQDGSELFHLNNIVPVSQNERKRLYNVFNVDFIEEMEEEDFDSPGTAGGGMPVDPDNEGGASFDGDLLEEETWQDEAEEIEWTTE